MNEIITHLIAAGLPFLAYAAFNKYRMRREVERLLGSHLPVPKKAPSDWIIYQYDLKGLVTYRWVVMTEEAAFTIATSEKKKGHIGRIFKDGEIRREW